MFSLGACAVALALSFFGPVEAQQTDQLPYPVATTILLTLDQERLFRDSAFGKATLGRAERDTAALSAENRRIEQQLEEEERNLTERRATMPGADFALLANEFDTRVEEIRAAQVTKSRAITRRLEDDRKRFFEARIPILAGLLADKGALAILDESAIILSLSALDVTDEAIARIDAALVLPLDEEPTTEPAPAP